jgi:uncharacterized protein (TIGR02265 family)
LAGVFQVDWSVFESLFVRALEVDPKLKAALKPVGLDLDRPEPKYPETVLSAALDVAAQHVSPNRPRDEARRALGRRAGAQYFHTLIGMVVAPAMSLLGAERFMASLPRRATVGGDAQTRTEKLGERQWRAASTAASTASSSRGTSRSRWRRPASIRTSPSMTTRRGTCASW